MVEVVKLESGLTEYLNVMSSKGFRLVAIEEIHSTASGQGTEKYTRMIFEREKRE